jgi:hypothetical protein
MVVVSPTGSTMQLLQMARFEEIFCAATGCSPADFPRVVFWRTLPLHARVAAFFVGGARAEYFSPDRDLIAAVANARSMGHVREEIREFFLDTRNRTWTRSRLRVRISTRRLKELAREYLPDDRSMV